MKNWIIIVLCLIVLGITLFLLGMYKPMINWLTAIIGIVIGAGAVFHLGVSWGKFLDQTL